MGLRFRKSISIIPGIKLNFGKSGLSLSAGVPGFRKTFHTKCGDSGDGVILCDYKK